MLQFGFSNKTKYNSKNYFWPVFSTINYQQEQDGWFTYRKKMRIRRHIRYSIDEEEDEDEDDEEDSYY